MITLQGFIFGFAFGFTLAYIIVLAYIIFTEKHDEDDNS